MHDVDDDGNPDINPRHPEAVGLMVSWRLNGILNTEAVDQIKVEISSDSDVAGIIVDAIETGDDSGIFETAFSFTHTNTSSGNTLFTIPDDAIYAKYEDNTIHSPNSIQDDLDIKIKSKFES